MYEDDLNLIQIPHRWSPREYQDDCWQYFQNGGTRAAVCWHRRAGKDLFSINLIAKSMIERPGLYWHLFPYAKQAREVIWNGNTKDGRPFLDHFPGWRNPGAKNSLVETKREDTMTIRFRPTLGLDGKMRETGGTYQLLGVDEPDRLVGPNPFGVVFSEWSLMDPRIWHLIKPILNENGGWALFIFTMRGRNHAFKMLDKWGKKKEYFSQLLTVRDTYKLVKTDRKNVDGEEVYVPRPVITEEMIQEDRDDGVPEATIQMEYYGNPDAPIEGAYYGAWITKLAEKNQIINVPHDPKLPVHTAWDIGHDTTAIIPFQAIGQEIRIINYFEASGEGLPYYVSKLKEWQKEEGYLYELHYAPHDIEQREWASGGKSKLEIARSLGIKFILVKHHTLEDGIEEVRAMLPRCWIDKTKCAFLLEAARAYHKEYDEKNKVWKEKPVHDWASHPMDALRQLAMGFREKMQFRKERRSKGETPKAKMAYNALG